jgi:hypothetical protein
MTVSGLLEQPCNKSDNINKLVTTVNSLLQTCDNLWQAVRTQLVDGLLSDLLQDVRFLCVYNYHTQFIHNASSTSTFTVRVALQPLPLQKICKQSLWLDYKKEGSTNPVAQTISLASLFLIIQTEACWLFCTNRLWISTCNFFASVANRSEQSAYQNCNIVGQYCNVARKRTSGLTVIVTCMTFLEFLASA